MDYISVLENNKIDKIPISMNKSMLELMVEHSYALPSICGGRGTCGKCKIQVLEGDLKVTAADKKYFSVKELEKGYRLACVAYPVDSIAINLFAKSEEDFYIPTKEINKKEVLMADLTYGIAVDIGTTTIAMQLVEKETGELLSNYAGINHQRRYGADVISRIEQANSGKATELTECIRKDIKEGILSLLQNGGVELSKISDIVISANSTMGHLFLGYSVEGLGSYPFTPFDIDLVEVHGEEIFPDLKWNGKITLLPGISAFVGGDVVSGLYKCGFHKIERPTLF
ncbi:MAG: 2Fe-2S iron-sulfur cluster binding domain-containing protein, partial [Clostridiales bacterium]|nr:2Fe-2S iron-sulfur cluster binding domain-containing protein [Clostridiales bacterium]